MLTAIIIIFSAYYFVKLGNVYSETTHIPNVTRRVIRTSHTITPDNPPSEEEWLKQYHNHVVQNFDETKN